jgi:acetoacetyl-CoA synthetase
VRKVLVVDYLGKSGEVAQQVSNAERARSRALPASGPGRLRSSACRSTHPLYILFSSGTTGIPKCIVHSAGGTLLQHLKEQRCMAIFMTATACSISPPAAG